MEMILLVSDLRICGGEGVLGRGLVTERGEGARERLPETARGSCSSAPFPFELIPVSP